MKTAMQTLISKLKTEISELNKKIDKYSNDTGVYTGHKYGLDHALSVAESLLEMEKQQLLNMSLMSAHHERKWILEHSTESKYNPSKVEIRDLEKTALEHYNETFKQQEQ
jgi:hypothetical protein